MVEKKTQSQEYRPLPPHVRKSMRSGLITLNAVSENDRPESSVLESINWDFDAIGSARIRKGCTALGNQQTGSINGMHYFVDTINATPNTQMIIGVGNTTLYLAGSFTAITTNLTGSGTQRFSTFLNFIWRVNGTDPTAVWNGNVSQGGFVTTGNALSAPVGKYIDNFRARMWIAGNATYPDRLYYSSIPSKVATPVVTWNTDPATGQWIDISPNDGDTVTALQRFRSQLLVFKTNRLYRVFDIGQVDPDPYYTVGTNSQESVIETKVGIFFHHSSGFYQYNIYGIVQEISRPVIDFIKAIPTSYYSQIVGWLDQQGDHISWMIGTVTVNGVTYTNCVLRYTISTQTWTHRAYPVQWTTALRRQPFYNDGTTLFPIVGDSSGNVFEPDTGTQDISSAGQLIPLPYSLVHNWETVDGLLSTRKTVMVANFTHYGGAGSNVAYQTQDNDPDTLNDWSKRVGQLKMGAGQGGTGFNSMDIKARKFRFRIWGQSTGLPFTYNGYELIEPISEFIQFT